jgi:hypothetical protein
MSNPVLMLCRKLTRKNPLPEEITTRLPEEITTRRGADLQKSVEGVFQAVQRAQLPPSVDDALFALDRALRPYYNDTEEAFLGRITEQSK